MRSVFKKVRRAIEKSLASSNGLLGLYLIDGSATNELIRFHASQCDEAITDREARVQNNVSGGWVSRFWSSPPRSVVRAAVPLMLDRQSRESRDRR